MTSPEEFRIQSTSAQSAKCSSIVISENSTFQKIIVPEVVRLSQESPPQLKISIITRRKTATQTWEKMDEPSSIQLKAQESKSLNLTSEETTSLFDALKKIYKLAENEGFIYGEKNFIIFSLENNEQLTASQKKQLLDILKKQPKEILEELIKSTPDDITQKLSIARIQEKRQKTIQEFEKNIENKTEKYWQQFFETNKWIFGLGLDCKFLHHLVNQPIMSGANIKGEKEQRGDFLVHSEGHFKFTVIIEIKTPTTALVEKEYRKGVWEMGKELIGGVSQVQAYCKNLDKEMQDYDKNSELIDSGIHAIYPKGILLIGNTKHLDSKEKRRTFELYRRHITNPQIITFDELLERARHIASVTNEEIG